MSIKIQEILKKALNAFNGQSIHVRMEMPYKWGVTLSGEIDRKDIKVPGDLDFAKYANQYRSEHPEAKCNIIDFYLSRDGKYEEKPRFDEAFQKAQDAL